jgi:hypothetical protein
MGRSVTARLVFGVDLDRENYIYPWQDEETGEGELDEWWLKESGFKPTFYPFTEEGQYKEGVSQDDPLVDAYYEERRTWIESHPCPVEQAFFGWCDESGQMLIVPDAGLWTDSWSPLEVKEWPSPPDVIQLRQFLDFVNKYVKPVNPDVGPPAWLLTADFD